METPCPLCGATAPHKMTMPIHARTFRPTAYGAIYECAACRFGFVWPRPTLAETAEFYELEGDVYYTRGVSHMATGGQGFWERLRLHLAWRLDYGESLFDVILSELPAGASIVDIGCGDGAFVVRLCAAGYTAIGVERDAASLARQRGTALEGSAEALPRELARGSQDAIVFSHVLEHLIDPVTAFATACALLKPGGLVFCEVPNNESLIAKASGLAWAQLDIPLHINFFTDRSLRRLVALAGARVKRGYFCNFYRYFSDSFIATEQRIHDRLPHGLAKRNSKARSWAMLARAALATPARKYDSVGLVAAPGTSSSEEFER
jgi:SAM-dependent methyltransferase